MDIALGIKRLENILVMQSFLEFLKENKSIVKRFRDGYDEDVAKRIEEGYFKSYPNKTVVKQLEKFVLDYSDEIGEYEILDFSNYEDRDDFSDFQIIGIHCERHSNKFEDKLESKLISLGWYIGDVEKRDEDGSYLFYVEPKFPIDNSKISKKSLEFIHKYKKFYHVSLRKYEKKIDNSGLLPALTKRQEYKHPERIYLFGIPELAIDFIDQGMSLKFDFTKLEMLRKIGNSKKVADEKYQQVLKSFSDYFVMYQVDLEKMSKDKQINLYHDNRYGADEAFFTVNTIQPKYLRKLSTEELLKLFHVIYKN